MSVRWWRIVAILERAGEPWTWTFHVRASNEAAARRLVDGRLAGERFALFVVRPSDPLARGPVAGGIAADYGPWRRDWSDPAVARLRPLLEPPRPE
ncbi:MAG: hypothetical protein ACE5JG_03210 [Planctomycetota bacterium]